MRLRFGRLLLIAAALLSPLSAFAASLRGAAPGRMLDAPDGQSRMEQLTVEPALAPALLGVPLEGRVRIEDWPVAPGVRRAVVVTRHDVYAPDAKIVATLGGKEVEIPRSKLVFLWGTAEGDGATSVLITLDPDTATVYRLIDDARRGLRPPGAERRAARAPARPRRGPSPGRRRGPGLPVRLRRPAQRPCARRPARRAPGDLRSAGPLEPARRGHRRGHRQRVHGHEVRQQHDERHELHRPGLRRSHRHLRARPLRPPVAGLHGPAPLHDPRPLRAKRRRQRGRPEAQRGVGATGTPTIPGSSARS